MYILGISAFYHDSAACIIKNDEIMAAAQEERFTRVKNDPSFPAKAIQYCLEYCGIRLSAVSYIVFYEKPFLKFERLLETYLAFAPRGIRSYLTAMPLWIQGKLFIKNTIIRELKDIDRNWHYDKEALLFTGHHQAHAASAFFPSPFEEALVLTMDGVGERTTTSVFHGSGNTLKVLKEIHFPHSIGLLYSAFTYYLGFKVNSDEYKVMGLAPYGKPVYTDMIYDQLIDLQPDGSFKLNMAYFNYCTGLTMTSKKFDRLFGAKPRHAEEEINSFHMDIACSIQQVTEEVVLTIVKHLYRQHQVKNLCLAGGVALNCVINGRLLLESGFENIWIQPAAGDAGGALGAAYAAYYQHLKNERLVSSTGKDSMKGALLGPCFTGSQIKTALAEYNVTYHEFDDSLYFGELAKLIAEGNVIGWFSGRMEFGPRALGSRSIIADPRHSSMQSVINKKIKFRESFRPFAPAVLAEHAQEYFDLRVPSPYMLFTASISQQQSPHKKAAENMYDLKAIQPKRTTIPAVTHVNNSARIQTVSDPGSEFYQLISSFYQITDCPLVVNTSFNIMNEPIVCTPQDAIRCFLATGLDILAFKNIIVYRSEMQV